MNSTAAKSRTIRRFSRRARGRCSWSWRLVTRPSSPTIPTSRLSPRRWTEAGSSATCPRGSRAGGKVCSLHLGWIHSQPSQYSCPAEGNLSASGLHVWARLGRRTHRQSPDGRLACGRGACQPLRKRAGRWRSRAWRGRGERGAMNETDGGGLRHLPLFYRDQAEYRAQILGFARAGIAKGEPSLIAVPGDKGRLLSGQLDAECGDLQWSDMAEMGRNPARIIPELRAFIDKHPGQRVRFVGEPIWPGRSPAEICEATRHEALINLAFPATQVTILCPYDVVRLAPSVIAGARHTHPEVLAHGRPTPAAA